MTNEQTAILLRAIALRIRDVADNMAGLITEGERLSERHWIGEGEEPKPLLFPDTSGILGLPDEKRHPYYREQNWEWRKTGGFVAIWEVESLAGWIEEQAAVLVTDDAARKAQ